MSDDQGQQQGQQQQGQQQQGGKGKPDPGFKVLQVVQYTHHDGLLNREHTDFGVIVRLPGDGGGTYAVRPLAGHHLEVAPADLVALSADDVTED